MTHLVTKKNKEGSSVTSVVINSKADHYTETIQPRHIFEERRVTIYSDNFAEQKRHRFGPLKSKWRHDQRYLLLPGEKTVYQTTDKGSLIIQEITPRAMQSKSRS